MTPKAKTYRAILTGLAIIIIVFVIYFIYKAVVGTKKVVQNSPVNVIINPAGSGQSIRENAPVSNQPAAGTSGHSIVPVQGNSNTNSSTGIGTNGNLNGSGGVPPAGYDTANHGPQNGTSPCNAYGKSLDPACQKP